LILLDLPLPHKIIQALFEYSNGPDRNDNLQLHPSLQMYWAELLLELILQPVNQIVKEVY